MKRRRCRRWGRSRLCEASLTRASSGASEMKDSANWVSAIATGAGAVISLCFSLVSYTQAQLAIQKSDETIAQQRNSDEVAWLSNVVSLAIQNEVEWDGYESKLFKLCNSGVILENGYLDVGLVPDDMKAIGKRTEVLIDMASAYTGIDAAKEQKAELNAYISTDVGLLSKKNSGLNCEKLMPSIVLIGKADMGVFARNIKNTIMPILSKRMIENQKSLPK